MISREVSPTLSLEAIERLATGRGLRLRLKVRQPVGGLLRGLRVAVAREERGLVLLGELKGLVLPTSEGLRLDTMRVQGLNTADVGNLIWAATFAWAMQCSPCRTARLLAIRDADNQHRRLVRYFERLGFEAERELGSDPLDLPLRLLWGGSGLLMHGDCREVLKRCSKRLISTQGVNSSQGTDHLYIGAEQ